MALISVSNLQAYMDRLAAAWRETLRTMGTRSGTAVQGTVRGTLTNLLTFATTSLDDYDQEYYLITPVNTALGRATAEIAFQYAKQAVDAVNDLMSAKGSTVASSIVDLSTFLTYYNGGSGGAVFSSRMTPECQTMHKALYGNAILPVAGVMSPGIHPDLDSAFTAAMGTKTVAGVFTAGNSVDTTLYSEVKPIIEVLTTFTGGAAAPTVTITGTDDLGASTTWGPITLTGNNPTGALTGITITPAVTIAARQTVAVSSATGIVAGSVLVINSGLSDQESVVVETVAGTDITAVFRLAHGAGATVSGHASYAAGVAASGATRRLRAVTGITLGLSSHSAGTVRIAGQQDRVAI